mgnify:CR=1 FL=1
MQNHLRIRTLHENALYDRLYAQQRIERGLLGQLAMPRVIRADHQHYRFRIKSVQLAVADAPQHILRAVAGETQIDVVAVETSGNMLLVGGAGAGSTAALGD